MDVYGSSEEHQPVTWVRGHPIYAAHIIVAVFVASMIVTTVLMAAHLTGIFVWLPFGSAAVLRGEVWRVATYGLLNPPSLPFAVDMLMIVWFGREVERFFGRRTFLQLYAGVYLLSPLLFTLIGLWWPMNLAGETGAFALFIAFATLFPNAPMIFNVLAKWAAWILVAIFTLMALAANDWTTLVSLWATVGFAYAFVRYKQGRFALPSFRLPTRKPKLRVLPDLEPPAAKSPKVASMAEVDALLDKIARSGMASLTAKERAKLDAARANLLKKDSGR
jgi:membrane associated rhomboid family serine protease